MIWLVAIWVVVGLLVIFAYLKPGFRNATQILKGYSRHRSKDTRRA